MANAKRASAPTAVDYTEFRELLENRKEELLGRNLTTRERLDDQESSGGPGDEADSSVMDVNTDYFLKLAENERREILEIRRAIQKINVGSYGLCEKCRQDISAERLQKLPYARLCLDCQAGQEALFRVRNPNPTPKL